MSCLDKKTAHKLVNELKRAINTLPREIKSSIYSIAVFGSLPRSDFVDDVSDVDILIVFENNTKPEVINEVIESIKDIEKNFRRCEDYVFLDIVWIYEREIPLKDRPTETFFQIPNNLCI